MELFYPLCSTSVKVVDSVISTSWCTAGSASWEVHAAGHSTSRHAAHATWHSSGSATSGLVYPLHDRVELGLDLLPLALDGVSISLWVGLEPLETVLGALLDRGLVLISESLLKLLLVESVLDLEAVVLESVLSLDLGLHLLVLSLVLLGVVHHLLDVLLGQSTLVVGDGDLVDLLSGLVTSRHVQNAVCVDIESDLNL